MDFSLRDSRALLARTPSVLDIWLRALPRTWLMEAGGAESWSPFDILGHLIHGERTDWMPRLAIILEQGTPRPFDAFDRTAQFEASQGVEAEELLDIFRALRSANLEALDHLALSPGHLDLQGTHPEFGRVSVRELLASWVVHDLSHIAQIARVMVKHYDAAVGPWKAYFPLLTR